MTSWRRFDPRQAIRQPWANGAGYTDQWGRGVVPVVENPGMTTTSINPGKKNISVIDHVIPIATYLDQLVSQKASAVRMWAKRW